MEVWLLLTGSSTVGKRKNNLRLYFGCTSHNRAFWQRSPQNVISAKYGSKRHFTHNYLAIYISNVSLSQGAICSMKAVWSTIISHLLISSVILPNRSIFLDHVSCYLHVFFKVAMCLSTIEAFAHCHLSHDRDQVFRWAWEVADIPLRQHACVTGPTL